MNYVVINSDEYLAHHGVLGMKWGVRRYQNKDGSLTAAGKRRYARSPVNAQKDIKTQIRKARKKQYGWSNQWMSGYSIGPNSKEAEEKYNKAVREHENSKNYKEYQKKFKQIDAKYWDDPEKYEQEWEKLYSEYRNSSKLYRGATLINNGWKFEKAYAESYGKDITVGYLKDLGYNKESIDYLIKKMGQYVVD